MSWLSILFWVITNLPSELAALQSIIAFIHTILGTKQASDIQKSISDAIESGDKEAVKLALSQHQGMPGNSPQLV